MKPSIYHFSVFVVLIIGVLSCQTPQQDSLSPDTFTQVDSTQQGEAPVMSFEKTVHEFGKLIQGERVMYVFKFVNTGKTNLVITNASTSCGCTVPNYPKSPVKPGDSGEIEVSFDTKGKMGVQQKEINITANTNPASNILTIKAVIEK